MATSNVCSQQGQQKQVVQDCGQLGFKQLQVWRLHNLCGKPVLLFDRFHSKIR